MELNDKQFIELIELSIFIYFGLLPFIANMMWQENTNKTFVKWYFTKSPIVNYLGFLVFLILFAGSFFYLMLYYISILLFYIVFLPICWLFEFLFLNKECKIESEPSDKPNKIKKEI